MSELNVKEMLNAELEYNNASKKFLSIKEKWVSRAKEICELYYNLNIQNGRVYPGDNVNVYINKCTVFIHVKDFENETTIERLINIDDFTSDNFKEILKKKYMESREQNIKENLQAKNDAEYAEFMRLKKKFEFYKEEKPCWQHREGCDLE